MFTAQGPGGIFGLYTMNGAQLGYVFVNEFVCVSYFTQSHEMRMLNPPYSGFHPRGRHLRLHRPDEPILPSCLSTVDYWIHLVRHPRCSSLTCARLINPT